MAIMIRRKQQIIRKQIYKHNTNNKNKPDNSKKTHRNNK